MSSVMTLCLRLTMGVCIASVLGALGYFAGWFFGPPNPESGDLVRILVSGAGAAAGIGGVGPWMALQENRRIAIIMGGLSLAGGVGGAWGGYFFGMNMYSGGILPKPASISIVLGGGVGSSILPFLVSVALFLRRPRP